MGHEDEPTDEYRFIGRARPPQPKPQPPSPSPLPAPAPSPSAGETVEPEPSWDEPTMPVDDVPGPVREATSRADKQRNQRR
jgi:hypothetical protein